MCNLDYFVSTLDLDECSDPSMCRNGTCSNVRGSYRCVCDEGFQQTENGDCAGEYQVICNCMEVILGLRSH